MAAEQAAADPSPGMVASCQYFGGNAFLCCRRWQRGSPHLAVGLAHVISHLGIEAFLVLVDSLVAWFWNGIFVIFFCLSALLSIPRALVYVRRLSLADSLGPQTGRIALVLLACALRVAGCAMTMISLTWTISLPPPGTTEEGFTAMYAGGCAAYGVGVLLELGTWQALLKDQGIADGTSQPLRGDSASLNPVATGATAARPTAAGYSGDRPPSLELPPRGAIDI
jgi:hypothetical protein